ncbi:MAG: hypothetical protein R6W75_03190 [Smithellaceae bacterium]
MRRSGLSILAVLFLVFFLAAPSMAWQGRMAGAGDAAGLIADESDFLIHPAAIASGKGFNAYGHYGLTYEKTTKWDYKSTVAVMGLSYPYEATGDAWKNSLQLGAAFALGAGRMGVFFEYDGVKGKYDGQENYVGFSGPEFRSLEMEDRFDTLKLRALYGIPVGAVNLGAELQIAYVKEEKETLLFDPDGDSWKNYPWAAEDGPALSMFPYMIPFKSKYWEAQGKVSVDGNAGAVRYAATLKAGMPFASDNQYVIGYDYIDEAEPSGNVKGFNVGGDFWLRVPVSDTMVLPFVVSAAYKSVKRDGTGPTNNNSFINYDHTATNMDVRIGGGVDITPAKGTKVAAGLYYDYISAKQDANFNDTFLSSAYFVDTYADMPKFSEHRLTLKALAEKDLKDTLVLRGGISAFYGKVKSDYAYSAYDHGGPYYPLDLSTSGSSMGVNASIGATVKLAKVSLEPFINAGYASLSTDGEGFNGPLPVSVEMEKTNWHVGGGLSVKF